MPSTVRDPVEEAVSMFQAGFHCAEAVAGAFADRHGVPRELALRAAGAFGSGSSRSDLTCGAVAGALITIGFALGRTSAENVVAKERTYGAGSRFCAAFKAANGALSCTELLGLNLSTPEGLKTAQEQGIFKTRCPALVRSAAAILQAML